MNNKSNSSRWPYFPFLFLIGLVSAYDTALIVVYQEHIWDMEKNPVGRWLLETGDVSLFVCVKAATSIIVLSICALLVKTKYRKVIFAIAAFQLYLFWYLTFNGHMDYEYTNTEDAVEGPLSTTLRFYMVYFLGR